MKRLVCLAIIIASIAAPAARGGPIDEYHKALNAAKKALEDARHNLKQTEDGLRTATNALAVKSGQLDEAVKELSKRADAAELSRRLKAEVEQAKQKAAQAADNLAAEAKKQEAAVRDALEKLLAEQLTVIDLAWSINTEFAPSTSKAFSRAQFPLGKYTQDQIESALKKGGYTLPELSLSDCLNLSVALRVEAQCDFEEVVRRIYRDAAFNSRIYVSSRSLAELLSAEH